MSKKRELAGLDEHFFEKYTSPVKRHSRKTDRWGFSSDPTAPLKKKRKVYSLATQEVPVYGRLVKSQEGMGIAPVLKLPIDDFKRYHNNECDLCGFGGRLVLCSSCTLSFHYRCLKDYIQEGKCRM